MDKEIRKVDDVRDDITKIDYEIAELFEKRRRENPFIIKIKKTKSYQILQRTDPIHLS